MDGDRMAARSERSDSGPAAAAATLPWPSSAPHRDVLRQSLAQTPPTLPDYLLRHYWWAYLWPPAVWFFDHQPIIDAIVFGQYRKLTRETLRLLGPAEAGATVLIASAYGHLVPSLAAALDGSPLTVVDVAPIQLERARRKLEAAGLAGRARLEGMNAEHLDFADHAFDSAMMFLLLHELPEAPRRRALTEALRVLRSGGQLVLAEYGELTRRHPFHRFAPLRWIFGTAEPFLPSLWHEDLDRLLAECAATLGKRVCREERVAIFGGFYRVLRYRVEAA